jgi:hypothetical protein
MKVTSMSMHACMTSIHTLTQNVRYSIKYSMRPRAVAKRKRRRKVPPNWSRFLKVRLARLESQTRRGVEKDPATF